MAKWKPVQTDDYNLMPQLRRGKNRGKLRLRQYETVPAKTGPASAFMEAINRTAKTGKRVRAEELQIEIQRLGRNYKRGISANMWVDSIHTAENMTGLRLVYGDGKVPFKNHLSNFAKMLGGGRYDLPKVRVDDLKEIMVRRDWDFKSK